MFLNFRKIRTSVVSFACLRGVEESVEKAKNFYNQWMMNETVNL
jgi:UDP-glucose 4-epimerase